MERKSSAYYQRLYRQRLREQGLIKKEIWILPKHANTLSSIEHQLRQSSIDEELIKQEENSMQTSQNWTASSLYAALLSAPLFREKRATVQLLECTDPILYVVMHDYGELPLFIAVSGAQIVVEGTLWKENEVKDVVKFNDAVLRTHKLFPLSSIALEAPVEGLSYYIMFGALGAASLLENIVVEIETLADNIIKATEAYASHLKEFSDLG
ncbi:YjfI family protein [Neisseria sp. Ec49-e6-T10]|uniref:YjfI family protein n=1 Tax=Neisseria sp. Ec49-e6-T10 TaxID=3140744 RepID=UPI003EB98854